MIAASLVGPVAAGAALAWTAVGARLLMHAPRQADSEDGSDVAEKVVAIYLFYRTGEPLVAMASGRSLPIEAEQLEGLLYVVGHFVETSTGSFEGYATTAMVYDDLGILAVRGRHAIAAAVYEGPAFDGLREELTRTLRSFESRRGRELESFDGAVRTAEQAADELSRFLHPEAPRAARRPASVTVLGAHAR